MSQVFELFDFISIDSTMCPYLLTARNANLLKHLLCINDGRPNDLIKHCEEGNLNGLLGKEIAKLNE